MNDFILYFKMGLNHVLDFNAYDHILFLIVLAVIFSFNKFKKVLYLVTLFTIGHSITLALAAFGVLSVNMKLVEFLIPVTIFITGTVNVFTAKQAASGKDKINLVLALLFGFIHGLGFSNYFNMMIGRGEDKIIPLLEFSLGIEAAQIIIVVGILLIGTVLQNFLKVNKRDWILVCSSIVIGFAIQMMLNRIFW
ncbi:HupE/UreJ family protein [Polaribacter sp.]|nr:HupE/UreJ family protein [Polaribacter sp.]